VHGIDERLVAVSQVDRAPTRGLHELLVWPAPVRQLQGHEGAVLVEGHLRRRHWSRWHVHSSSGSGLSRKIKNLLATPVAGGSASARLRSPLHKKETQERGHCGPRVPAKPEFVTGCLAGPGAAGLGSSRAGEGGRASAPANLLDDRGIRGAEGRRIRGVVDDGGAQGNHLPYTLHAVRDHGHRLAVLAR